MSSDKPDSDNPRASVEEILKRQTDTHHVTVGFKDLWKYASAKDFVYLAISTIAAIVAGAILPCFPLLFGDMASLFQRAALGRIDRAEFNNELNRKTLILVYLGIGAYVATYISTVGFMSVAERVTRVLRRKYLDALLRQNMAFFDSMSPGALSSRISLDCQTIQDGMSEKVAFTITGTATLVGAYVVGFIKYWKLTLVASSILVAIVATGATSAIFIVKYTKATMAEYSVAGGLAEEAISTIRTVKTLGAQSTFTARFDKGLVAVEKTGRKAQITFALMVAVIMTMTYMSHSLTFWTGSRFIEQGDADIAIVTTVAFAILIASHVFGAISAHVRAFGSAVAAAGKVYATIDRLSPLDPASEDGQKLDVVSGAIELKNIRHIYPSRPGQVIMDGTSLWIPAGKTTAVVGPSGSGKSTIIGLLERFYLPVGGQILLDGHDISTLNLRWLRQQMGLVGQEPVLFGSTIWENIVIGLAGREEESGVSSEKDSMPLEDHVEKAAKQANAHDFIKSLPNGYQTKLGDGGSQLSGGQKQRIAIARALISNPPILLLDEATSALDTESERLVKSAIQSASIGRTTLVISHRLSSVTHADNIIVLSGGAVVEQGTHETLSKQDGLYKKLFQAQQLEQGAESPEIETPPSVDKSNPDISYKRVDDLDEKVLPTTDSTEGVPRENTPSPEDAEKQSLWTIISFIASFNKPEKKLLIVGLVFSILAGSGSPALALLVAKAISELSKPESMISSMREGINYWCLIMFVGGLAQLFILTVQGVAFAICAEKLIYRARSALFRSILAKDTTFFDRDQNRTGALTSLIGLEAKHLSGVSGQTLGTILMSLTTLVAAITISLAIGWKVALVCMATIPILLGCGFYRTWMIAQFAQRSHEAHKASSAFASEIVSSARTVVSLAYEHHAVAAYEKQLLEHERKTLRSIAKSSLPYAAAQSFTFFCVALAFWYGGNRIADGEYTIFQFFLCFAEIIFGAQAAGLVFSFSSDMGKAKKAADTFYSILHRDEPTIDTPESQRPSRRRNSLDKIDGKIEFKEVQFTYPNRPERPILRGLNLTVHPGEYVALVGSSGCGKSTCFGLLERLYDPDSGVLTLDDRDIRTYNVNEYRRALAYVSQEPSVYSGTLRENIALGIEEEGVEVTDEDIFRACKDANIYDFVVSLPDGLATAVGPRGVTLSGGQKQRIAIARALIKDPRVLLLDEATSALDSESERLVQDALDKAAAQQRTTIAVAHRISTVRNADRICFVDHGIIVESGTHEELMSKKGRYWRLARAQDAKGDIGEV